MDLSDENSSRADDFSTLKEFFESDPAIELQIRRCFAKFLQGYRSEGEFVYLRLIQDLCLQNRNSLEVSYMHLAKCSLTLAINVYLIGICKGFGVEKIYDSEGSILCDLDEYEKLIMEYCLDRLDNYY